MTPTSIGDLALGMMLRTRNAQLKAQATTLLQELTSGRKATLPDRFGGDLSHLADIEQNLTRLSAYKVAAREAAAFTDAVQLGLAAIDGTVDNIGSSLIILTQATSQSEVSHAAQRAREGLSTVIASLNGSSGGRSLFAGAASDGTPLRPAEELLDALRSELAGLSSAAEVEQAMETWFNDPQGFRATLYTGSDNDLPAVEIAEGQQVALSRRADDPVFRDTLRFLATAALAGDPALTMDQSERVALLTGAGNGLLNNHRALIETSAEIGAAEGRIENAMARNNASSSSLEQARNALVSVDRYETATRLEEVQFQLESLYAVTVRTAHLSLLNFLR